MNATETAAAQAHRERLLSRRQIAARGWTPDMIGRFLPLPDRTTVNPYNVRGAPVKLYFLSTIFQVESSDHFKQAMTAAAARKAGAQAAVETKRRKLRETLDALPAPELPALSETELCRAAVLFAALEFLLAELEPYRQDLTEKCRGVAVRAVDEKILKSIAAAHPWLFTECRRRMANADEKPPTAPTRIHSGNARRSQG
ncbi:MAG: hypothetical protein Q8S00_01850 [Deltaproteobacteria bacterium]|nr:hypothetical protein [Deltaproteobacteria bacterium]MDZ4346290.1 hypothetical protein [Candidatus Binatia bacterium]